MKYRIYHWFACGAKPVPEAYQTEEDKIRPNPQQAEGWHVDVEDIHEFTKKYGPVILYPPNSKRTNSSEWYLAVTDETGKFNCK